MKIHEKQYLIQAYEREGAKSFHRWFKKVLPVIQGDVEELHDIMCLALSFGDVQIGKAALKAGADPTLVLNSSSMFYNLGRAARGNGDQGLSIPGLFSLIVLLLEKGGKVQRDEFKEICALTLDMCKSQVPQKIYEKVVAELVSCELTPSSGE